MKHQDRPVSHKLNLPLVRQALQTLAAAQSGSQDAHRDALERARSIVWRHGDALARAEFTLAEARLQQPVDKLERVIADLYWAADVFRANGRCPQEAMAWSALVAWECQSGREARALEAAKRALAIDAQSLEQRLILLEAVLPVMAESLGFQAAWQCYERHFDSYVRACPPCVQLARARVALASVHVVEAIQAAGLIARCTMHVAGSVASLGVRSPAVLQALARGRQQLAAARGIGNARSDRLADLVQAGLDAVGGRVDDAVSAYRATKKQGLGVGFELTYVGWALRVNGRFHEALPLLHQALDIARRYDAGGLEQFSLVECAICADETGDAVLAARAWREAFTLLARSQLPAPAPRADDAAPEEVPGTVRAATLAQRRVEPPYLARAVRLMSEHLAPRWSLARIARECGVSPRTLQAAFRDFRSATFVESYRDAALQRAHHLLLLTNEPVKEVARQAGFGSPAVLSRQFGAAYGLPPAAFRSQAARRAAFPLS